MGTKVRINCEIDMLRFENLRAALNKSFPQTWAISDVHIQHLIRDVQFTLFLFARWDKTSESFFTALCRDHIVRAYEVVSTKQDLPSMFSSRNAQTDMSTMLLDVLAPLVGDPDMRECECDPKQSRSLCRYCVAANSFYVYTFAAKHLM